jgi:hypothetical protein
VLFADQVRRRCTVVPVGLLAIGLALGVGAVAAAASPDLVVSAVMGGLAVLVLAWFVLGVRRAFRDGDAIEVRSARGRPRVPGPGCTIALRRGGSHRSPQVDVILKPARGPAQRLARLEHLGIGRAPAMARRIAAVLDVGVDEPSVGELEAQLAHAAQLRRGSYRWLAGVLAVGVTASIVVQLYTADRMATLEVRCPGGQVREGGATMLDGLRMTASPGPHTFELHPAGGPAWTQRFELVAGQTTVLDCSARPTASTPHEATTARPPDAP